VITFNEYLAHGNAWLFLPAAILLGALHGLEPGHSKTMMAAFIVAIRGTIGQAVLLDCQRPFRTRSLFGFSPPLRCIMVTS
jgi:ABC-type nickel/cobalt efflux system permease component RcnA